jgi:putative phosphoribosyl transferase
MRFRNREAAAALLSDRLAGYRGRHPLVLGVPRGAVPMARIIADALDGDLDVVLVRKLRAPDQPELAIGAIDEAGKVLRGAYFHIASEEQIREETLAQQEVIRARRQLYTGARAPIDPAGRIAILVDDGVATGSSMLSAIQAVRLNRPAKLVVAIGVAPMETLARLGEAADEVVCLYSTDAFMAVGQFFDDFSEVTDEMVVAALKRAPKPMTARPR